MISPFGYRPIGLPVSDSVESYPVEVVTDKADYSTAPPLPAESDNGTSTVDPVPSAIP